MKSTIKWVLIILVLFVGILCVSGLFSLISKGITGFKIVDLAGITFIVGIVIYFVARTIKGIRKDSKDINDGD